MVEMKTYYQTTSMTEEQLMKAIESAKDQENIILNIFKRYGTMTSWDVYEVHNQVVGGILPTSVGRSINTLVRSGSIYSIGEVTGPFGRPVRLYTISEHAPEVVRRKDYEKMPKSVKLDIVYTEDGEIDVEKMVYSLDDLLQKISKKFNLNY